MTASRSETAVLCPLSASHPNHHELEHFSGVVLYSQCKAWARLQGANSKIPAYVCTGEAFACAVDV